MKGKRRGQRGFTVIEVLVSVVILAIGSVSTFALVDVLVRSNYRAARSNAAVAAAHRLVSEISRASFAPGSTDPGLAAGTHLAAVDGSTIRSVGFFRSDAPDPVVGAQSEFQVQYTVQPCVICETPIAGGTGLPGLEILVQVDNAPGRDGPLVAPVLVALRREETPGVSGAVRRGFAP